MDMPNENLSTSIPFAHGSISFEEVVEFSRKSGVPLETLAQHLNAADTADAAGNAATSEDTGAQQESDSGQGVVPQTSAPTAGEASIANRPSEKNVTSLSGDASSVSPPPRQKSGDSRLEARVEKLEEMVFQLRKSLAAIDQRVRQGGDQDAQAHQQAKRVVPHEDSGPGVVHNPAPDTSPQPGQNGAPNPEPMTAEPKTQVKLPPELEQFAKSPPTAQKEPPSAPAG